ncbi:tetratricopeptide repeat protein [Tumebacillus lipolyticus]|uniref:Tetratricopeptide repeat protein n=1 Tax=Tumebacillus lipolyticus TaxID=1280370 RepID=A0ABW4ZXQ4_9BACL
MKVKEHIIKIGNYIRHLRKEKGLSQQELADGCCSQSFLSQLEKGIYPSMPSLDILQGICNKLGLSVGELFSQIDIDRESLEVEVLLDLIQVHIHRKEFELAYEIIEELQKREDLLQEQRHKLALLLASCLIKTEEYDQAIELLTQLQLSLEEEQHRDDHMLADVLNKLGNAYYFQNNRLNAYANYRRAFQITTLFPKPDLLAADISYNLGNVCKDLRFDADARAHLENAKNIYEVISEKEGLASTLYYLGIVYKNIGDLSSASELFKKSRILYESLEIYQMAKLAQHLYAFYILSRDNAPLAIDELLKLADEHRKDGDISYEAFSYARAAFVSIQRQNFGDASELLKKATALEYEGKKEDPKYAYLLQVSAEYHLLIKDIERSIEDAFKSADLFGKIEHDMEMATSLEIAVRAYQEKGMYKEGLVVSQRVIKVLRRYTDLSLLP